MPFPIKNPALARALAARGYNDPTEVQLAVLAPEAEDRDLLVSAQTGSGKTVAFGLALASTILGDAERLPATILPLVLVIAPTRELALQVHAELTWLYEQAGGRVVSCVGGMDARREQRLLAAGCHIVVGTPGRLQDHINRGALKLDECEAVVLDEADEMLDLGFKDELEFILSAAPESRRTLLFSATIAREIANLARKYQQNALRIDTVARNQPHADIEYRAIRVGGHEIEQGLVNLLRFHDSRALVFCSTRDTVRHLHASLLARGFNAVALSGELSQSERNTALNALREGRAQVCIATDVAARGLDLPDLDLVIHADLPTNKASLLHRSGRTGRAGRKGMCLVLVSPSKRRRAELLLGSANIEAIWQDPPTAAQIKARDQERLLEDEILTAAPSEDELALGAKLLERQDAATIAAALIRLYRSHLPEPANVTIQAHAPREPFAARPERGPRPARENAPFERPVRENTPYERRTDNAPMAWFRSPIGRKHNADPKWLIPLICRLGGITKAEIGAIRIFDRETKFEISAPVAEAFAAAITAPGVTDLLVEPSTAPGAGPARDPGPRPEKTKFIRPARPEGGKPTEQERRRKNKVLKKTY
ncbi:DEAD/DEAH box helicase [Acidocella aquatica]|uniref:DEAD/DEAH box helicase n=1 Tax=Acidocella aquatica TaxID=1922313 RepID=A0ABQ6A734_9PROT|nr:DEAD/DEAH box helicase [Acidocella aquatica]GLR66676.1 DEAD/DEAH box helicase [Acidocella aquatica]